jgi:O-antigen/teichoic acid export membrane protein
MDLTRSPIHTIHAKLRTVTQFFVAQGLAMVGNLLYGILCVRLLPTAEYAKFVVVFGVQATLVILMDVNFCGTLIPLVGERTDDHKLIAEYVASLRRLADYIFVLISVAAIFAFPWLVRNRGWDWRTECEMFALLLVACWFLRVSAAYGAVLIVLRDRTSWYRGQMISSFGTLALLGALWAVHWLNGMTAILLNVLGMVFVGIFYYFRARRRLGVTAKPDREKQRAIVRLALPNLPQSIFFALQGQIALFLIAIFGHTSSVASIGALGRLGQIFALPMQMNPLLVTPYFAKLPRSRLAKNYFIALAIAGTLTVSVGVAASRLPGVFLWVLGPKYRDLRTEVVLVITAAAIACFSDVLWTIHSARRFVYWTNNILNIICVLTLQILFITHADLSKIRSVLWLNLGTNIISLLVNVLVGVYGFFRGPRQVEAAPIITEEAAEAAAYLEQLDQSTLPAYDQERLPAGRGLN